MDMNKILHSLYTASSKPVEGSNDMKKFFSVVTEGTNPNKVSLPVQMAMNYYQQPAEQVAPSLLKKYFIEASEEYSRKNEEERENKNKLINQYAQVIAERVRLKTNKLRGN